MRGIACAKALSWKDLARLTLRLVWVTCSGLGRERKRGSRRTQQGRVFQGLAGQGKLLHSSKQENHTVQT